MDLDVSLIIRIVDDSDEDLRLYQGILQNAFKQRGMPIVVETVKARQRVGDYHDIVGDPRTAALIVDQRLGETQWADHTGIQLATQLRRLVPQLPIYILTTYADVDDFQGGKWSVEDVLRKQVVSEPDHPDNQEEFQMIMERLIRRINVHQTILEKRGRRYRELLKKSLEEQLTQEEKSELDDLQFERTAVTLSDERDQLTRFEAALNRLENLESGYDG